MSRRHRTLLVSFVLAAAFVLGFGANRYTSFMPEAVSELVALNESPGQQSVLRLTLHQSPRPIPVIRFQDGTGREMSLAHFRGRAVLLNLWATWCPPCRKEMPSLDRLQSKLGGLDFEVVALSIDHEGTAVVQRFYNEIQLRALKVYVDPTTDAAGQLGIAGIPGTVLIDRAGREIGRALGPAEWDSQEAIALIAQAIGRTGSAPDRTQRE